MTEGEIANLIDFLAEHPEAGDEIAGTGGCRKVRVAGRGKGKSGGYRTITFYSGKEFPLYPADGLFQRRKVDLTKGECNDLRAFTKALVAEHKTRVQRTRR